MGERTIIYPKWLAPDEISEWLRNNGQIEDPYLGECEPCFKVICYAPAQYRVIEYFLRGFLNEVITNGDLLIQVTDWGDSEDCRDFVFQAIRHEFREMRRIEHAPGFLVSYSEKELAISVFAMMICFAWKGYLYGAHDQCTLYNWEGEIFDFWSDSAAKRDHFRLIINTFKLQEIVDEPDSNDTQST